VVPVNVRPAERLPAGLLGAAAIVGLTVVAHVAGGGRFTSTATLGLLTVVVLALGLVLASVRRSFGRLLIISVVAQPVIHVVLDTVTAHGTSHGPHAIHQNSVHTSEQHAAMLSSAGHDATAMWVVHVVAAVVTAVVVRWGWRWLRSMPALLRAIVYSVRSVPVVDLVRRLVGGDVDALVPNRLALLTWDERAPPPSM
jgi:hypothetical protein